MKCANYQYILIIASIIFSFSQNLKNNNELKDLINNYILNSYSDESIINLKLDNYVSDNINNNQTKYYKLQLPNDAEEIFFDYQSDYGCLYINIENDISITLAEFKFCSKGTNNIFSLNKSEIIKKMSKKIDSIKNLYLIIGVGFSSLEFEESVNFDYSLKVSLRKPNMNIFEINSEHKILCKSEKVNETNYYRCLFIISIPNYDSKNLIIYSFSYKKNNRFNIYADYINKENYNQWNINFLSDNIPNINSSFTNNNTENNFILIPNLQYDKYIYLSVELIDEETIEIYTQFIAYQYEIKMQNINELKIYSFKNETNEINFDLNDLQLDKISLSFGTIYGKAKIYFEDDNSTEYITDIRENKIILNINLDLCRIINKCNIKVNYIEDEEKELKYIFYVYFTKKLNNILNELEYGQSNKIFYSYFQNPIILYEKISNNYSPININLQFYKISPKISNHFGPFKIKILVLSKEQIYNIKLNYNYFDEFNNIIKRSFDSTLFASNIYLSVEELKLFNIIKDPYLIISIANNNENNEWDKLIIGSTISQTNCLIYASERIYHLGQLNNEEKSVHRLKGNNKYHLMRLEFGSNSNYIGWSVKRTNNNISFMKNDSDLSFVTEKWSNGRELLTMYIERGEDIYLTIFPKEKIRNVNLTNYIFKYINSGKNRDFKNYLIKDDSMSYDVKTKKIRVNILNQKPSDSIINYYLSIINKEYYIEKESINTIALMESKNNITLEGKPVKNKILFELDNLIDNNNIYYTKAYCVVNSNYSDIEYISYSGLTINPNIKVHNLKYILASLIIGGIALLIIFINFIVWACKGGYYSRNASLSDIYSDFDRFSFNDDTDLLDDDFS